MAQEKNKTYMDRLSASKEDVASRENQFTNNEARLALETSIHATDKEVFAMENNLEKSKGAKPLDPIKVYDCHCRLELLRKKLDYYKALKIELFPDASTAE